MAKPRVFVSSTYYDLKHIRKSLDGFINDLGYEGVFFEDGDIVFHHDKPVDQSCYEEISNCHIFVLIIGGRYGSLSSLDDKGEAVKLENAIKSYNSVTKKEYETARDKDIPIYIFIEKGVHAEYQTFKQNRDKKDIKYAHVDNINIFLLIDEIYAQKRNNLVKEFDSFIDISSWLKEQWAGLFTDLLIKRKNDSELSDLSSQVTDLRKVSSVLKEYSESMMRKLDPDNFEQLIFSKNKQLLDRRLDRFRHEGMIQYLLERSPKGVGIKTLFDAFQISTDLVDFLEKAKYTQEFIDDFMGEHGPHAIADYEKMHDEFGLL